MPKVRSWNKKLVYLHGMWSDDSYFENYVRMGLSQGFEVVTVVLPFHHHRNGEIDYVALGKTSLRDYAAAVSGVIKEIGECVLIGHSMGAFLAQMCAADPQLRLLIAAAVFMTSGFPRGIIVVDLALTWTIVSSGYLKPILAETAFRISYRDKQKLILNRMTGEALKVATVKYMTFAESGKVAKEASLGLIAVGETQIRCRTCVVGATHDKITPYRGQLKLRDKYDSHLITAEGHGHLFLVEEGWEKTAGEVYAWIRKAISLNTV